MNVPCGIMVLLKLSLKTHFGAMEFGHVVGTNIQKNGWIK